MSAPFTTTYSYGIGALLFFLMVGQSLFSQAQSQPALEERITNIRLTAVSQTSLEIQYDLAVCNPGDSVYFEITGRKSGLLAYSPGFVEGDFGRHVVAGPNRRIVWNVLANGYELNEDIRVRVLVKTGRPGSGDLAKQLPPAPPALAATESGKRTYRPGGPLTALLSVVIPGLGNVFVQNPRPKVGFRPLLAVGVAGAIAYGFNQRSLANTQYRLYEQQKNPVAGESSYQLANRQYHRYYVATRAAVAVWLGDVVVTMVRGFQNRRSQRESSPLSLRPGYQANTPVAALALRF